MILKKIKIMNYRQLQSVELDMQESLTVLAGPNNSGKTTLISVLKGMFCDKKLGFSYSDIPISLSSMWLEKTVPVFQEIMHEYDKEKGVQKIIDEMTDNDKLSKDYTIDNFRAQIQVDYDPDSDNIQYFADYLMDLDDTKHSFYFIYTYEPSITAFEKGLNERYNRMAARVRDIKNPGCIEKETKFYFLKEELLRIYCNAVIEKCYFCNSNYKNENLMEVAAFKSLFNFQNIPAMRELDDNESDSSKGISKRVIALLKDNDTWVEATKKLPDLLMADIEDSGAKKEIKNSSIKSLDDTIRDISKTSGGHIGKLQLEMDVKEQDVEEFIRRITRAKYDVEGLLLNEESQGLGFSGVTETPLKLNSSLCFEFDSTEDYAFIYHLWVIAKRFIQYLCYRKNVFFSKVELSTSYKGYKHIKSGELYVLEDLDEHNSEEEVLKKGCYIRQSYITGAVGSILQSIAEDSIYLRHLPQNYEEGHHIDAARFVMITAAFEWEFRRIFPEGIKKKEKKIKAEETVVQLLTPLIENNTGEIKSILKYLKKCVGNDPLSSKLTFVGMELGNIIDIFGKHLYALNGKKLKYSEMGERLAAQRNNFAHGNLDKDFDELALLDLIYLELILYAMQLKFYGVEDVKIKKAINDLFHKNIRIDE